jgi:8-oxo-dGTP pyrophosphatase MutT (NUDIX family)
MIHRVRAAGLIVESQRILLVRHRTPGTERDWWIPPGGGLKPEDAGVLDTARRRSSRRQG